MVTESIGKGVLLVPPIKLHKLQIERPFWTFRQNVDSIVIEKVL